MVIVDTSVWIRFLRGRQPYASELDRLLDESQVLGHELIYGELLIGDPGDRATLLSEYRRIEYAATVAHDQVVDFVRHRRLGGKGIGWIDAHLLASALVDQTHLWTADHPLADLARGIGVGYES